MKVTLRIACDYYIFSSFLGSLNLFLYVISRFLLEQCQTLINYAMPFMRAIRLKQYPLEKPDVEDPEETRDNNIVLYYYSSQVLSHFWFTGL